MVGATNQRRNADTTRLLMSSQGVDADWHPSDPANTTPQLLASLWDMIVNASDMERGEERTTLYPNMQEQLSNPSFLNRLLGHFDNCKDVCDTFGTGIVMMPLANPAQPKVVTGFTVKSYKSENPLATVSEDGEYNFSPDPFWDDDFDPLLQDPDLAAGLYDDEDDDVGVATSVAAQPEIQTLVPPDDETIENITRKWVDRLMSSMGICPFTSGPDLAGMPMGNVFYTTDRSTEVEDVYARYWKEVVRVEQSNEKDLSTTLLITPEFSMSNVEGFENFSNTLTQPLESLEIENLLQLVFFHPRWTFRDGGDRMYEEGGSAANYARRSPWPMINILRTNQVRAAQKGIPTGLVYQQNEKTLNKVGVNELEKCLRLRDWDSLEDEKVNRRDHEALRVAQDMQQSETGEVNAEDLTLEFDNTPKANKMDRSQVEGGDIVNVVLEALKKRVCQGTYLTGQETSATLLATDFLIKQLDDIAAGKALSGQAPQQPSVSLLEQEEEDDAEMAAIFGGGGIM